MTPSPSGQYAAQSFAEAVCDLDHAPRFLIRDRDAIYGVDFRRRVKGFGTRCLVTPPRAPRANAFCEGMIGTLRRDCLDNVIVLDDCHAERILREYARYYCCRPHRGLRMQAPVGGRWLPPMRPVPSKAVRGRPVLGGLHHEYRIAVSAPYRGACRRRRWQPGRSRRITTQQRHQARGCTRQSRQRSLATRQPAPTTAGKLSSLVESDRASGGCPCRIVGWSSCGAQAAKAAGIDEYRAERISPYDFRHSRLTHLGQVTSNLSGVMYLAGHRQPSTTAKYMRPQRAAAEEVLQSAGGAGNAAPRAAGSTGKAKARRAVGDIKGTARTTPKGEFWRHTGDMKAGENPEETPPNSRDVQRSENSDLFDLVSVELMGIEPTASRVRF